MMKKRTTQLLALALAGMLSLGLLAGCQKDTAQENTKGSQTADKEEEKAPAKDSIVIATGSEPSTLSPTEHNALAGIYMNLLTYNTLVTMDENMQPVADLAESYENTSDTEWVFHLRQGVKFHDGSDMTAEDVVASLERAKTCTDISNYTTTVETVTAEDDYTIRITTPTPTATLLYDLSNHGNAILPKEPIDSGNDFGKNPIGTGPYKFVDWQSGVSITFEAFDDYYAGAPAIKDMTWKIIPEGSARTIAPEAGEVDFLMEVETVDLERIEESEELDTVRSNSNILSWMTLNNEKPGLDNEAVRHAINCAINKEDLVTVAANGLGSVAVSQLPVGMSSTSEENGDTYDVEKAKQWLEQSGVDPASIELSILCSNEGKRRMAEVIQANLKEIGINCEIESLDTATYVSVTAEGNFTASIGGYSSTDIVTFLKGVFHSNSIGSSSQSRTNIPEIDAQIDAIASTIDDDARDAAIVELNKTLNQLCPQIPLYQGSNVRAFNQKLQGVNLTPAGLTRFEQLSWAQ